MHDAPVNCDLAIWRGSQVVRSRSAKPLFAGSIPAPASPNADRFVSVKVVSGKTGTGQDLPGRTGGTPVFDSFLAPTLARWPAPSWACLEANRLLSQSYRREMAALV